MDRRAAAAVRDVLTSPADGAATWQALLRTAEDLDTDAKVAHGECIARALLKHIPLAPLVDRLTSAVQQFAAIWPREALNMLANLLQQEDDGVGNASGVRGWVMHVLQLTQLVDAPHGTLTPLVAACNAAKHAERDRAVAIKIHALHMRLLAACPNLQPAHVLCASEDSDLRRYLASIPSGRNDGAALADELVARWPDPSSFLKDEYAATWFKVHSVRDPSTYIALQQHLIATKYVSSAIVDKHLTFSAPLQELLRAALPLCSDLTRRTDRWRTFALSAPGAGYVRASGPAMLPATSDAVTALLTACSSSHIQFMLTEIQRALCNTRAVDDADLLLLALWSLLGACEGRDPSVLASTVHALILTLSPRGFDADDNLRRVCVLQSLVADGRLAAWHWLWVACPGLLGTILRDVMQLVATADSPACAHVLLLLAQTLLVECTASCREHEASPELAARILGPGRPR
ncbi:hypothetical protein SDRG_07810 [Saprolegnia diclina VS20]|uniref:Uncharacterized protein n=1 Tax=Saprolegnia diclina (strain VS20) TaxID=1156394 RepID=T0RW09_SAPDV|nr:hypothetical protein SDRG_07810 [Saprolegnia diclina VS20]EQC34482.1 hypothetical protein SDRG_07810 [Saprolegnia diclina VS20]|eukprot:XP_008611888.1 hypothetical protein SDRG_07810 [Saprolegnia diclina VS20]